METSNFPDPERKGIPFFSWLGEKAIQLRPFSRLGEKITEWHINGEFKERLEVGELASELLKARREDNFWKVRADMVVTRKIPDDVLKRAQELAKRVTVN